jgi:hypothetical protein
MIGAAFTRAMAIAFLYQIHTVLTDTPNETNVRRLQAEAPRCGRMNCRWIARQTGLSG